MKWHKRTAIRGFTVVELLVAMLLGLLLGGAIITVFVENRRSFNRDETVMRMQDDARQSVRELVNDMSMAGYWSDLVLPTAIVPDASLDVVTDCGPAGVANWIYQAVTPGTNEAQALIAVDNATAGTANGTFSCIDGGEIVPGTDVVAIKRLAGARAAVPTVNSVYLRTNGTLAMLYREPAAAPPAVPIAVPFADWEYRPSIYYVRNFATQPADGIPTLCRKVLQYGGAPTMATECLAQGIEDLQVEYGLDISGDGEPNAYVTNPTLVQMQTAVSARIYVLARSANADTRYTNDKTYQISNAPAFTPNDNFYRRVYTITVGLKNMASLRRLRS